MITIRIGAIQRAGIECHSTALCEPDEFPAVLEADRLSFEPCHADALADYLCDAANSAGETAARGGTAEDVRMERALFALIWRVRRSA